MIEHQKSSTYRPEIDGLRALAVGLVVSFHFGLPAVAGGFVGVDVFFVISGYLITQKLLAAHDRGGISFRDFYVGRVRRLLPALYTTLLATALGALLVLTPDELSTFGSSLLAAVFSVANLHFWSGAGYWDPGASTHPLLHTWSLSVEEQFYLVWPAFMVAALRMGSRRALYSSFAVAGLGSLLAAEWVLRQRPTTAFFWMPFRVVEFAVGGLAVAADAPSWRDRLRAHRTAAELLSAAGLVSIVASALAFDESTRFPGLGSLPPCLGTVMVIVAHRVRATGALLTNRPAVFLGLVSYSLYLVHWPLRVFFEVLTDRPPGTFEAVGLLVLALISSVALFHFVETPLRQPGRRDADGARPAMRVALKLAGAPAALLAVLAAFLVFSDGLAYRFAGGGSAAVRWSGEKARMDRSARREALCADAEETHCGHYDPQGGNVLILGDSLGVDALNTLAAGYPEKNFILSWRGGCPPLVDVEDIDYQNPRCPVVNERRFAMVRRLPELDAVVLWMGLQPEREALLEQTVESLYRQGRRVVVFGPGPRFTKLLPRIAFEHGSLEGLDAAADPWADRAQYAADERLAPFIEHRGGAYVSQRGFFCPEGAPCRAVTRGGENLLLLDAVHLTAEGAAEFGRALRERYPRLLDES